MTDYSPKPWESLYYVLFFCSWSVRGALFLLLITFHTFIFTFSHMWHMLARFGKLKIKLTWVAFLKCTCGEKLMQTYLLRYWWEIQLSQAEFSEKGTRKVQVKQERETHALRTFNVTPEKRFYCWWRELWEEAPKSKRSPSLFGQKYEANHRAEAPRYQPTFFSQLPSKVLISIIFDRWANKGSGVFSVMSSAAPDKQT